MSAAPAEPQPAVDRRTQLELQDAELTLARFDLDDAWWLGSWIVAHSREHSYRVAVDIRRVNQVLFHAALPGATPDNEHWIAQKSATCLRMERASSLVSLQFEAMGLDPLRGWLPEGALAAGGSVPIKVTGAGTVAAVTVSGLSSDDDHDVAVAALEALREHQG
ncbi:heme-binding protein [Demequina capsici]|uniref:Heme-binding protein n=1 Tax=Demequina capsici TaxID=3075620 RepID=A0AA96JCT6_9MICO|nr:heme-binding protein [Demequina sp. PMTSA13]WNM27271.1 heme-binding protein [Demequina sp. PMTSA13]